MKVGIAQLNTIVGDLNGNRDAIIRAYHTLVDQGAEMVVFPEMVVTGYPPRDLLFKSNFVADTQETIDAIAAETGRTPAIVGYVTANEAPRGRPFFNAAGWCERGKVRKIAHKSLLPTYDVFDEDRYFESAAEPLIVTWRGWRIGVTICEDIWSGPVVDTSRHYQSDPLAHMENGEVDVVFNLSASPWHYGKDSTRQAIVRSATLRVGRPVVYVNAVGGNDELIFDGHSMVMSASGELISACPPFTEDCRVVDLEQETPDIHPQFQRDSLADIHDALVLGVRDYAQKSGFKKALIGLSGGIDSALTAALAVNALGKENIIGISLPSSISSEHSRDDARILAKNLGIEFHTLPVESLVKAAEETLAPIFKGKQPDVTEENIQARARGMLLMAVSNKFHALLLTTGNKSEISVGYCTLYGDMAGGLAVISDLPKTRVYALSQWINRKKEIIPWNTITKAPSAELRPGQKDEDSLPPYPILDSILKRYVEERESSNTIIEAGYKPEIVRDIIRKVDLNEYKRKQMPPGLKISPLAFGLGRRIPIVQKYVS